MEINKKLRELYESKWKEFSKNILLIEDDISTLDKPTNPLLLNINENDYLDSDIKIMIFGQETNDWDLNFKNDIEHCLVMYNDFFNTNGCYSYGGQFWNGYSKLISKFKEKYETKKIATVWNNVIKVGAKGRKGRPSNLIYDVEKKYFDVIKNEIEILKPDFIIFLSGPDYDDDIKNIFADVEYNSVSEKFSTRQLSELSSSSRIKMFRTYHPNYLWRNNIDNYYDTIIQNII